MALRLDYDITTMLILKSVYPSVMPYITKDGSEIRELMHPNVQGNTQQSLAEATIPPGAETALHLHRASEEIYYFIAGEGTMRLARENLPVGAGDTVAIPSGTPHNVRNTGLVPMKILCACAPAYQHDDTVLLDT